MKNVQRNVCEVLINVLLQLIKIYEIKINLNCNYF